MVAPDAQRRMDSVTASTLLLRARQPPPLLPARDLRFCMSQAYSDVGISVQTSSSSPLGGGRCLKVRRGTRLAARARSKCSCMRVAEHSNLPSADSWTSVSREAKT